MSKERHHSMYADENYFIKPYKNYYNGFVNETPEHTSHFYTHYFCKIIICEIINLIKLKKYIKCFRYDLD